MALITRLPWKDRKHAELKPDSEGLSSCSIHWEYCQAFKIDGGISLRGRVSSISPLNVPFKGKDFNAADNFPVDLIIDFHSDGMKYVEKNADTGKYEDKGLSHVTAFEHWVIKYFSECDYQFSCVMNIAAWDDQPMVSGFFEQTDEVQTMVMNMLLSSFTVLEKQDNPMPEPAASFGSSSGKRYPTIAEKLDKLDSDTICQLVNKAHSLRVSVSAIEPNPGVEIPLLEVALKLLAAI